jgi:L-malate glycosyltransferase
MRLAFISTSFLKWGGSEVFWYKTAKEALQLKHKVLISIYHQTDIHPYIKDLEKAGAIISLRRNELDYTKSSFPFKQINYLINKKLDNQSFKDVLKFKPDNVTISLTNTFDFVWHKKLEAFLLNTNIPFYLVSNFNDEHKVLPFNEIINSRIIFKKASGVVFASFRNWGVAERQIAMEIPKEKTTVLRAPSNIEKIEYINYPQLSKVTFCSLARFEVTYKGQDILFQVLSKDQWKERDWILNLYGEGEDEKYLKELAIFYGISDKVFFKGYHNDLRAVWKENNMLLMPSLAEGTPIVLMISMLCGRSAVVTNVAGNGELISDGVNGFVAESATPESFANAMEKAWINLIDWEKMGKIAFNTALEKLDLYPEKTLMNLIANKNSN